MHVCRLLCTVQDSSLVSELDHRCTLFRVSALGGCVLYLGMCILECPGKGLHNNGATLSQVGVYQDKVNFLSMTPVCVGVYGPGSLSLYIFSVASE